MVLFNLPISFFSLAQSDFYSHQPSKYFLFSHWELPSCQIALFDSQPFLLELSDLF